MGRLWTWNLIWFAFVTLAAAGTAVSLAVFTWLVHRPEAFWTHISSYWLSRHSAPFWVSAAGLSLAGALTVPSLAWPPSTRELRWVPAGASLAGLTYALLRFGYHAWQGIPMLGQFRAFWPDVLMLSVSLSGGSLLALLILRWTMQAGWIRPQLPKADRPPASTAPPLPAGAYLPSRAGNPASPGEPRDARSVRRGRIRGHRPGDHRHGPQPRRHP